MIGWKERASGGQENQGDRTGNGAKVKPAFQESEL